MMHAAAEGEPGSRAADPVRVMVVDDSAVIRGLLTRALEADPEIAVVASVGNGQMAISALARAEMDVIVGLSNCPLDVLSPCNGYRCTPVKIEVDAAS